MYIYIYIYIACLWYSHASNQSSHIYGMICTIVTWTNPYLLHKAVNLVTIIPSQRTSLDSDIGVSREVLVVTTVVQDIFIVRVWWDDVSWYSAIGDFAVKSGWIQTCKGAWICNNVHYNVWVEITYLCPNLNSSVVDALEGIRNFIPHFTGFVMSYPLKLIH